MNKPYHIIVEGAELSGKSFIISQLYNILEPEQTSSNPYLLDGCHWFNCDVGIFGSNYGKNIIEQYIAMAKILKKKNIIFEKFHLADKVYNKLYCQREIDYSAIEKKLAELDFKIIFLKFKKSEQLIANRLQDRLNLYPHYQRIAQTPAAYLNQQDIYAEYMEKSSLPILEVDSSILPNEKIINQIITWLKK